MVKICGPKYALCGLIVSVWGIFQLLLMGAFFYMKSVAMIEDLPLADKELPDSKAEFYKLADQEYERSAYNCWIAAIMYLVTLVISGHQFFLNSKTSLSV